MVEKKAKSNQNWILGALLLMAAVLIATIVSFLLANGQVEVQVPNGDYESRMGQWIAIALAPLFILTPAAYLLSYWKMSKGIPNARISARMRTAIILALSTAALAAVLAFVASSAFQQLGTSELYPAWAINPILTGLAMFFVTRWMSPWPN
jgi:hypothetical protein